MYLPLRFVTLVTALAFTGCFCDVSASKASLLRGRFKADAASASVLEAAKSGDYPKKQDRLHGMHALEDKSTHLLAELGREMLATQSDRRCKIASVGSGHGVHSLCAELLPHSKELSPMPCVFYSYGTSHDYTFDTMMADEWGCKGVALDPSVTHPSKIHPKVTFHNIAARTMDAAEDAQWDLVTTVPGLKKFLGHDRINVLKMDCEGCEYALAQDILREDPKFLHSVDQLAIEIHVSRKWLKSEAHANHLGMLYALTKDAGLRLSETVFGGCHPDDEAPGCHPVLQEAGFPCQSGMMCTNLLFARI